MATPALNVMLLGGKHMGLHVSQLEAVAHTKSDEHWIIYTIKHNDQLNYYFLE